MASLLMIVVVVVVVPVIHGLHLIHHSIHHLRLCCHKSSDVLQVNRGCLRWNYSYGWLLIDFWHSGTGTTCGSLASLNHLVKLHGLDKVKHKMS